MEYLFLAILVIIISIIVIYKFKKQRSDNVDLFPSIVDTTNDVDSLMIKLKQLPAETQIDETKLMEIKDNKVLARINNAIPELVQVANNAVNMANQVQQNGKVLYQAIIPVGARLVDSKGMDGAVRGMYRGAKGIKGHANLVKVEQSSNVIGNVASSAMGVASMVVGQYYMEQINAQLEKLDAKIDKIASFQNNEYKSRVMAVVAQIKRITEFQTNILESEELRKNEIMTLNNIEQECIELLGQANSTISDCAIKNTSNYDEYEQTLTEIQKWVVYQVTLLEITKKISQLKHALHLGAMSIEQSESLLITYSNQAQTALKHLDKWHSENIEKFEINVEEGYRKRQGIDAILHSIPALFNDGFKFRTMSENTVQRIVEQTDTTTTTYSNSDVDLFKEDVKIISKEGKIYYLAQ